MSAWVPVFLVVQRGVHARGSTVGHSLPHLFERIAQALGWTLAEVQGFSLASLRDIVKPVSPKLAHECTLAMRGITT